MTLRYALLVVKRSRLGPAVNMEHDVFVGLVVVAGFCKPKPVRKIKLSQPARAGCKALIPFWWTRRLLVLVVAGSGRL